MQLESVQPQNIQAKLHSSSVNMGFYKSTTAAVFTLLVIFSLSSLSLTHSFHPPPAPSLSSVIRNPCVEEWVACQDLVCFCPFKAKKPRGTFPGRERKHE